jgi:glucose-1-phosphate cytidylyltransferase
MYVGILAGGKGTRLSEETETKPKPMVTVGGVPILVHIMYMYSHYGFRNFVVALGYKGDYVRDYFVRDMLGSKPVITIEQNIGVISTDEDEERNGFNIHLIETGIDTNTAGRIRQILQYTGGTTMVTYGDGLSDVHLSRLVAFHQEKKTLATVTAVHPPTRFGEIKLGEDGDVIEFNEKPVVDMGWINGGFFVLDHGVTKYIRNDSESFESDVLPRLVEDMQLSAYQHNGFWQMIDNIRELTLVREMWDSGLAPWSYEEDNYE